MTSENIKFENVVNDIITKAENIEKYDYEGVKMLIKEYINIAKLYAKNLNPYVLEHVGEIEADLECSLRYKRSNLKNKYWKSAVANLTENIELMKQQYTAI